MYGSQTIPVGAGYRPGYFSRPDEAGQFPVVVLVPGLGGLDSAQKSICRKLARNGLAVVAVEIFSDDGSEVALTAYHETSDREVTLTLQETVEYLQSDDIFWALSEKVGLLGFDVGGRPAIVAASRQPWAGSLAVVSTPLTGDEEREHQVAGFLGSLPVAVLGLYGEEDPLIANETVDEAQSRNEHGVWLLYEAAAHSFWDDESDDYDASAALDLETRLIEFFRATLPQAIIEDLG